MTVACLPSSARPRSSLPSQTTVSARKPRSVPCGVFLVSPDASDDDREDIIQEIRVHVWHKLSRLDAASELDAWVRLTARSKALNLLRDRKEEVRRQARVQKALGQRDDPNHLEIDPNEFDRALSGLPDDLRRVCDEILDGKTPHAVARVLGIGPGGCSSSLEGSPGSHSWKFSKPLCRVKNDRFAFRRDT